MAEDRDAQWPSHAHDPLTRRLMPLAYALVAIVVLVIVFTWMTLQIQTTLAGFLNGESIWSKAQKQATVDLLNYVETGADGYYRSFEANYHTLLLYREVRQQAISRRFSYAQIEQELHDAHAMPVAIPGVIFALAHFSFAPYLSEAFRLWASTDDALTQLGSIAAEARDLYTAGNITPSIVDEERAQINAINSFIEPRSNAFSVAVAQGAIWIDRLLFFTILGFGLCATMLWLWTARRMVRNTRSGEERYRLLFENAPNAVVMVDMSSGLIVDANRITAIWSGRDLSELLRQPCAALFDPPPSLQADSFTAILRHREGSARPVEVQISTVPWRAATVRQLVIRDVSDRVERNRTRRIAARALAAISEGVLITDADWNIISVNQAALRITGFERAALTRSRLDATRKTMDGAALNSVVREFLRNNPYWSGEVESQRADGSSYPEMLSVSAIRDAGTSVSQYVAVITDISTLKADRRRLRYLAAHDRLTGLVNRAEFETACGQAVARAARERNLFAVLFIDLDTFKQVNDSYSHAVGDQLLTRVAERISSQLRAGDLAGRIGGDEFTVLAAGLRQRSDAAGLAERIVSALTEPFDVAGYRIGVGASVGVAVYPLDGLDAPALIANADAAMYAAKIEQRDSWRLYLPTMHGHSGSQALTVENLRRATLDKEFHLLFQPIVDMRFRRIISAEALLRWQLPGRGEVPPSEFIPVAEHFGLIRGLDEWVMQKVCAQLRAWSLLGMPRLDISVNVSAHWLTHADFIASLQEALRTNSVDPARIVLELTESALLRLDDRLAEVMEAIKRIGVSIAIDDFGTGYASLSYLKLPAVRYLKIDQSFVKGLPDSSDDVAITRATLAMAHSLGLTPIAEGVEKPEQHDFLLLEGCARGQGYLYSYPLPCSELERLMLPQHRQVGQGVHLVSSS